MIGKWENLTNKWSKIACRKKYFFNQSFGPRIDLNGCNKTITKYTQYGRTKDIPRTTDIATQRMNWPLGEFCEKRVIYMYFIRAT